VVPVTETSSAKVSRRSVDKFAERRSQLAESALVTLSELGYARTSLREIAQNSAFSHGVLHYYFTDKVDLIMTCVRQYKAVCVTRYDQIVYTSRTAAELRSAFAAGLVRHPDPGHVREVVPG
jgi:AcrR family transcriptional regulator